MKDETTGEDVVDSSGLGFAYNFGDAAFKINYLATENNNRDGVEILDLKALGYGLDYKWSAKNTATIAYYVNKDDAPTTDAKTKSLVISNEYTMGEATTLYAALASVDADAGMSAVSQFATSIVASPAPVGETTTLVNVGVNFAF